MIDNTRVETATHTLDGQTYDAAATHVIELSADITAAGLRQALRQFDGGRVIVALARGRSSNGAPAVTASWAAQQRAGSAPAESGLVLLQSLRRQADAQGLEVALVTRDERLRAQAADVGIPVFGSVQGAAGASLGTGRLAAGLYPSQPRPRPAPAGQRAAPRPVALPLSHRQTGRGRPPAAVRLVGDGLAAGAAAVLCRRCAGRGRVHRALG
ncbi:MAG: hypothetical protein V9H69_24460 [Anaerolineae bacterium]